MFYYKHYALHNIMRMRDPQHAQVCSLDDVVCGFAPLASNWDPLDWDTRETLSLACVHKSQGYDRAQE